MRRALVGSLALLATVALILVLLRPKGEGARDPIGEETTRTVVGKTLPPAPLRGGATAASPPSSERDEPTGELLVSVGSAKLSASRAVEEVVVEARDSGAHASLRIPLTAEETRRRLPPGRYQASWYIPDVGDGEADVRIVAGETAHLDIRGYDPARARIPPGAARVWVSVSDVELSPVGAARVVLLEQRLRRSRVIRTDAAGRAVALVEPGDIIMSIGDARIALTVASDQELRAELPGEQRRQLGEVDVTVSEPRTFLRGPTGRDFAPDAVGGVGGQRYLFLSAGRYSVMASDENVLGAVDVSAGAKVEFFGGKTCRLALVVDADGLQTVDDPITLLLSGVPDSGDDRIERRILWIGRAGSSPIHVDNLPPGRYTVRAADPRLAGEVSATLAAGRTGALRLSLARK